jgi:hypothetical protein
MKSSLGWLQNWYKLNCNGDWEHEYGIEITTIDNPGWRIIIDLIGTNLESLDINYNLQEKNPNDWYGYSISESKFMGVGDPNKLEFLIELFKEIVKENG